MDIFTEIKSRAYVLDVINKSQSIAFHNSEASLFHNRSDIIMVV